MRVVVEITREFEVDADRDHVDGKYVHVWNAIDAVTVLEITDYH